MTRSLTGYIVDMMLTQSAATLYGGLLWPAGPRLISWETILGGASGMAYRREPMSDRIALKPVSWGLETYTTGTAGAAWIGGFARTVPAAKAWVAFQLLADIPTGTEVKILLQDAAGAWRKWTGAAWAVANPATATDWNTEAQIQSGIATWSGTFIRPGFRLQTSSSALTPRVFGCRVMSRIWAPGGYADNAVVDVVLTGLRLVRVPVRLAIKSTGVASISLAGLKEYALVADDGQPAFVPMSVHDRTADPGEAAELFVSWDQATHAIALAAAPPPGNRLLVDAIATPLVARMTSDDYFELARFPAVVVENIRLRKEGPRDAPRLVLQSGTASIVPRPTPYRASMDLTLAAGYDVDVQATISAVDRQMIGPVFSALTGEAARMIRVGDWEERSGYGATSPWELYGFTGYAGADTSEQTVLTVEPVPVTL